MWRKVSKWYQDWEDQQIAVLEKPELASQAAQGYRRFYYCKLAERSPVEREQLRDFSVALKGWRGWLWTAALLGFFSLCGLGLHVLVPNKSLVAAILTANAFGIA